MKDDAFEAKYMHDGSKILHRDKRVSRKMALLLSAVGVFMLFQAISLPFLNSGSARPMPESIIPFWIAGMGLLGLAFFVLAVMLGVLRFVVTERAVHAKYGLWGPTIPLETIVACKVVDYDWLKYGGWGIRRGLDGSWAYVPGSGSVVEITYRGGKDGKKEKKVVLGAHDPHALARSILEATAASTARVRIGETALDPQADERREAEPEGELTDATPPRTLARRSD